MEPDGNILVLINHGDSVPGEDTDQFYFVERFRPEGVLMDKWTAEKRHLGTKTSICVDSLNNIYINEMWDDKIKIFSKEGNEISIIGGYGLEAGKFDTVEGIGIDENDNLYVTESGNHRVQKINTEGEPLMMLGSGGTDQGRFMTPEKIAVGPQNRIYVADSMNKRVQIFEPDGGFYYEIATEGNVISMAVDNNNNVYTVEEGSNVRKYAPNGAFYAQWGTIGDIAFESPID